MSLNEALEVHPDEEETGPAISDAELPGPWLASGPVSSCSITSSSPTSVSTVSTSSSSTPR